MSLPLPDLVLCTDFFPSRGEIVPTSTLHRRISEGVAHLLCHPGFRDEERTLLFEKEAELTAVGEAPLGRYNNLRCAFDERVEYFASSLRLALAHRTAGGQGRSSVASCYEQIEDILRLSTAMTTMTPVQLDVCRYLAWSCGSGFPAGPLPLRVDGPASWKIPKILRWGATRDVGPPGHRWLQVHFDEAVYVPQAACYVDRAVLTVIQEFGREPIYGWHWLGMPLGATSRIVDDQLASMVGIRLPRRLVWDLQAPVFGPN